MATVKIVTGYIDIPDHPRGAADYRALGEQLFAETMGTEALVFDSERLKVETTWLAKFLQSRPNVTHAVADNPAKNTVAYHCVQHEKFQWLQLAHQLDRAAPGNTPADTYVWIDYGILHVPGVTGAVIRSYLDRIDSYGGAVVMPGCWSKKEVPADVPCWRFCGGLIAVPRALVVPFTTAAKGVAVRHVATAGVVEWEVNTLARLESLGEIPISWYKADHNETMFTALR